MGVVCRGSFMSLNSSAIQRIEQIKESLSLKVSCRNVKVFLCHMSAENLISSIYTPKWCELIGKYATSTGGLNRIHMLISVSGKVILTGWCSSLCSCPWSTMLSCPWFPKVPHRNSAQAKVWGSPVNFPGSRQAWYLQFGNCWNYCAWLDWSWVAGRSSAGCKCPFCWSDGHVYLLLRCQFWP